MDSFRTFILYNKFYLLPIKYDLLHNIFHVYSSKKTERILRIGLRCTDRLRSLVINVYIISKFICIEYKTGTRYITFIKLKIKYITWQLEVL